MPRFIKGLPIAAFRPFPSWPTGTAEDEDDVAYLHEDFVVTREIARSSEVVFGEVSAEWRSFCEDELGFRVPDWKAESGEVRKKLEVRASGRGAHEDSA